MFFSKTHWPQLTAPFYSILFETSMCQFNSSKCSPIMPDEVREHLTRDQSLFLYPESLQTLYIPSSLSVLPLFISPHSFSTGFRSEDWNGHSRSLVFCSVTNFFVVFGGLYLYYYCISWKIQTWPIIRFLTESVT